MRGVAMAAHSCPVSGTASTSNRGNCDAQVSRCLAIPRQVPQSRRASRLKTDDVATLRARPARRSDTCKLRQIKCCAGYTPFPWTESDYYQVAVNLILYHNASSHEGTIYLARTKQKGMQDQRIMAMAVSGDTMMAICWQEQGTSHRPLSLHLTWQILERGKEISSRDWEISRAAVVDLKGNTYIGRLFFGDAASGATVWDCDIRPSDSIWLSLKSGCKLYVKKSVWDKASVLASEQLAQAEPHVVEAFSQLSPIFKEAAQQLGETGSQLLTRIRSGDPEPIKLLKRKMQLALKEEDYVRAAEIRDHPYMKAYLQIVAHQKAGKHMVAQELQEKLEEMFSQDGAEQDAQRDAQQDAQQDVQ